MAFNRIVQKMALASVHKASQSFVLEVAIETQTFRRSKALVNAAKPRLIDKLLPMNTAKAVVREFEHGADNHIDVVCLDEYGRYTGTEHIVPKN